MGNKEMLFLNFESKHIPLKNGSIRNNKTEVLSDNWYRLNKFTYEYQKENGTWETQERESYDRGNGACILLYNTDKKTVILTRQFRMPTYVNGNESGMLIEVCAGALDGDTPELCVKKEAMEETGFEIKNAKKVFEGYTSPGAVTELMHFFIGAYSDKMKIGEGGGAENETENIEVLEYTFEKALHMIYTGEIKDVKTIMLLQYAALHKIFTD